MSYDGKTLTISHKRGDRDLNEISALPGVLVIKGEKGSNIGYALTGAPDTTVTIQNSKNRAETTQTNVKNSAQVPNDLSWISAVFYAFIGGLILNLMPCVFPVLSIKALSLVKMGSKEQSLARLHGIAYTIGVVLSFLIIGGMLVILKEAGTSVGWGFQLQNPVVVAILAYLLFIVGLNLVGLFEFGSKFSNVGNKLTQNQGIVGSFFTGTLATIVATPCTAPFMAGALGFAALNPSIIGMSVFAALGFGLAFPYLALSFIPALRVFLPKPGAWMKTFKEFLAFPMFASAIWLVWVMNQLSGSFSVLLVLLGMLAIAFSVWLSHHKGRGFAKFLARVLMLLVLIVPIFSLSYMKASVVMKSNYSFGEEFSPEKLSERLTTDKPVFVEMTAAWCITCKLNHAVAINIESTKKAFADHDVQYLIGDWTNFNDMIRKYIESFGRNGVPLYVYYAPPGKDGKRPAPILLPQVLTPALLSETVSK